MGALAFLLPPVLLLALYAVPALQLVHPRVVILASLVPFAWVTSLVAVLLLVVSRPRLWLVLLVAAAFTVAGLWVTWPYWPGSTPPVPGPTVSLMTMNMRCNSPGDDQLADLLRDAAPDVAVLNGLSRRSRELILERLGGLYPSSAYSRMDGSFECGTVVLSRHPIDAWVEGPSHPTAMVHSPGLTFALVAVDLPTPTRGMKAWLESFDELGVDVAGLGDVPLVAMGDFNAVLEHEPMPRLLKGTGLSSAVVGPGWGGCPRFLTSGSGGRGWRWTMRWCHREWWRRKRGRRRSRARSIGRCSCGLGSRGRSWDSLGQVRPQVRLCTGCKGDGLMVCQAC